jgi:hypothetical protein
LPASLPAHPTAQQSLAQAVDVNDHGVRGFLYLGHRMSFQPQLFSDKSLYEHLGRFASWCFDRQLRRIETIRGALQPPANRHLAASKGPRPSLHFSDSNLKKIRVVHVLDGYEKREIAKDYIW